MSEDDCRSSKFVTDKYKISKHLQQSHGDKNMLRKFLKSQAFKRTLAASSSEGLSSALKTSEGEDLVQKLRRRFASRNAKGSATNEQYIDLSQTQAVLKSKENNRAALSLDKDASLYEDEYTDQPADFYYDPEPMQYNLLDDSSVKRHLRDPAYLSSTDLHEATKPTTSAKALRPLQNSGSLRAQKAILLRATQNKKPPKDGGENFFRLRETKQRVFEPVKLTSGSFQVPLFKVSPANKYFPQGRQDTFESRNAIQNQTRTIKQMRQTGFS